MIVVNPGRKFHHRLSRVSNVLFYSDKTKFHKECLSEWFFNFFKYDFFRRIY